MGRDSYGQIAVIFLVLGKSGGKLSEQRRAGVIAALGRSWLWSVGDARPGVGYDHETAGGSTDGNARKQDRQFHITKHSRFCRLTGRECDRLG